METRRHQPPATVLPLPTYRVSTCVRQDDGSYQVDFDAYIAGEWVDEFYAILRAPVSAPFLSVDRIEVERVQEWAGSDIPSVADLTAWIAANRQTVDAAICDAFAESLAKSRSWR